MVIGACYSVLTGTAMGHVVRMSGARHPRSEDP